MSTTTARHKNAKSTMNAVAILDKRIAGNVEMQELVNLASLNAKVAKMIYDARIKANLTQEQLAQKIGTKQPVIARLEDADYEGHSLSMLQRIADALNLRLGVEFLPIARR